MRCFGNKFRWIWGVTRVHKVGQCPGKALRASVRSTEPSYAPVCLHKYTRNVENSVGAMRLEAEVNLFASTAPVKTAVNTSGRPSMNNKTTDRSDRRPDLEHCSKQLSRRATKEGGNRMIDDR